MKQFLIRALVFLILVLAVLEIGVIIRLSPGFINIGFNKGGWFKVEKRIHKSKTNIKAKRLYVGDSVGNQLFHPDSVENSLTSNAAVTMIGNYILCKNAIAANPHLEEIVLVSVPNDIGFSFEKKLVYNNFVKPFFEFRNLGAFEPLLYEKLWQRPVSFLSIFHWFKILPVSDVNFSNDQLIKERGAYVLEMKQQHLSDMAILYINKLKRMCDQHEIKLKLVSPPVPEHWLEDSRNWSQMREQIRANQLEDIFKNYLNQVKYLPIDHYSDGLHLKQEYVKSAQNDVLSLINNSD